jgi:hypothetical protein
MWSSTLQSRNMIVFYALVCLFLFYFILFFNFLFFAHENNPLLISNIARQQTNREKALEGKKGRQHLG